MALPKLACPVSRLIVEQSHLDHPQSRHVKVIKEHPFNYMLDTIIPDCPQPPQLSLQSSSKYYEARIQLHSIIHPPFIEAFVKRGELQLISCQSRIDNDDVISLTPKGSLCLHLTNPSYQKLGLVGKPSEYCRKTKQKRFIVEVDLLAAYFQPGRKNYERVRKCFTQHTQFYNIVFVWKPADDSIAAISVLRYFRSIGYECKEIDLDTHPQVMSSVTYCPVINPQDLGEDNPSTVHYTQLWEWLGAISCNTDVCSRDDVTDADQFISTFSCPDPHRAVGCVYKESITGMIAVSDVSARLLRLRELASQYGWCALVVHGFADAPVSWQHKQHDYLLDGDNIYTFIVFADGTYWLYYGLGSYDQCP